MKYVPIASVVLLAAVFLYAGIDKIFHYGGFVNALLSYALVPTALASFLAPALIAAELAVGGALLLKRWRPAAALAAALLLTLFTVALAINQLVATGSVCGCWFTITLAKSSGAHLAQNLVLLGLALTLWRQGRSAAAAGPANSLESTAS